MGNNIHDVPSHPLFSIWHSTLHRWVKKLVVYMLEEIAKQCNCRKNDCFKILLIVKMILELFGVET